MPEAGSLLDVLFAVVVGGLILLVVVVNPEPKPGEARWQETLRDTLRVVFVGPFLVAFWGVLILGGLFVLVRLVKWMWNA